MKVQVILLGALLFLVAGCPPEPKFYWYHPDRTFSEAKNDYCECETQAKEEAVKAVEDEYFDRLRSPTALAAGEKAPAKKKSGDPALRAKVEWGALYKQNAFDGCMESRGYIQLRDYQVSPTLKTKALPLGGIAGGK
jgi:hypothetical protein